jgi:hypothetical protein
MTRSAWDAETFAHGKTAFEIEPSGAADMKINGLLFAALSAWDREQGLS